MGIHEDQKVLGIKTNRHSSNWFLEIGNMVIAGCQIHYAIKTKGFSRRAVEAVDKDGTKQSMIYNADEDRG